MTKPELARVRRINRRLATESKKNGTPLLMVRTRRATYRRAKGGPSDLYNIETGEIVETNVNINQLDMKTRARMIRRHKLKGRT